MEVTQITYMESMALVGLFAFAFVGCCVLSDLILRKVFKL